MASVYERTDRAYIYAKIRDPKSGKWRGIPTPFRKTSPAAKRNALLWAAERDRVGAETKKLARRERWSMWVMPWLKQVFGYNRNTLVRYATAWAHLNEFIEDRAIPVPRELTYAHGHEYVTWRTAQVRRRGTAINHNTALTEARVMSRIMAEAMLRGYADANPWIRLGIRRQNVRHTQDMTQHEIEVIRAELRRREGSLPLPQRWMTISFEIALHHGVRLAATAVPMERIHIDARTDPARRVNLDRITFFEKGRHGKPKIKTLPVNPLLRPMLLALRAAGAKSTLQLPQMAAKEWWQLRDDLGLKHLRFHSTRATVTTQLPRNGVPMQKAMEIVGHTNEAVHLAYLHLTAGDVADEVAGLNFGAPSTLETQGAPPPI